jgi:hypothetical protein
LEPRAKDIVIEDIAHALARICRFGGHVAVDSVYSVAQHSVLVSKACREEHALLGLLHDASEAYIGDVIRPLKILLKGYKEIERRWELAIGEALGLGDALASLPADVKEADLRLLATERRDLLADGPGHRRWDLNAPPLVARIVPWSVPAAKRAFLARYERLLRSVVG